MAKRILDCNGSDFANFTKADLFESIAKSEGRVLACENIVTASPILGNISNAELASAMGADLILLNMFDVKNPVINGIPKSDNPIAMLKKLIARPIAINLEPVSDEIEAETDETWKMTDGRKATVENAKKAKEMGVDMIILTGNPGIGVTNKEIKATLKAISEALEGEIMLCAGKMHASGIAREGGANIITAADVNDFIDSGADMILLPAPGTVPGITQDYAESLIKLAHEKGKLAMTAIGTSQEGADIQTIRQIALMSKMAGADIHHLGDAGILGMSVPENITAYSIVIRGVRHTYSRMARSVNR
ncbi:MAG: haloacid dehalogenase-like hydrolase [Bacillota bacterium]